MSEPINSPRYPIYVVSKGRSQYMLTSRALTKMAVRHSIVVEPSEVLEYQDAVNRMRLMATVVELDLTYKAKYELCDSLGLSKGTGPGPARNFAWQHSLDHGHAWHWVMDDNIGGFYRLNNNRRIKCLNPAMFRAMEDFCDRFSNVAMAGPNYSFFAPARQKFPPFSRNTRIYSCNLIRNDVPFRWRGRYNEDTILSLDMLKAGWCTIQFYAFLQGKLATQSLKGGNTDEFYHREGVKGSGAYAENGTTAKSEMLARVHPDVASVVWRFGRVHHRVDYRSFRMNQLIQREGIDLPAVPNDYGMSLRTL